MTAIAWVLVALPIGLALYAYLVYPAMLRIMTRGVTPTSTPRSLPSPAPAITMVVPAYNEEAQIRGAIESLLAQDYPSDRRQILILSDASDDNTDTIVREYANRGVQLFRMATRSGKTAMENAAVGAIRGSVVINTDASIRMERSAVRKLVEAILEPGVGVASSRDVSVDAGSERAATSKGSAEAGYVGYEMRIRSLETRAGGIVGASGSGYAIRADLHRHPIRADLSRDFSAALTARRHGLRAVSVDDAICFVPRTPSIRREYRRKVRTISRGMETLAHNRDMLDFTRYPGFAWRLWSHKICRWLVPLAAVFAPLGLLMLAPSQGWRIAVIVATLVVLCLGFVGVFWPDRRPLPRWISKRVVGALAANLAVVQATWRFFHGHDDHIWEPTRRTDSATSDGS